MPDIAKKRDDGTYYFAKSVKQEPTNRKSIMQDIVLEPQEAENYIKHANIKPYNKEMSDKMRADGGGVQSPQFPQGAETLENPELKNFSSADDIIPQANENINTTNLPKNSENNPNTIYAKGGDNLAAGLISGVEQDENGNISINPAKFIAGLGGYTVAKKLLTNPKVQAELKDAIAQQLYRLERKAESGDMLAQNILGTNYLFTDPNLPKGRYMKGAFSDTATKQVMGEINDRGAKLILESNEKRANLGDILSHNELFKKYPEFKNIDTHIKIDKNAEISGKYEPKTNQIEIVAKDKNEAKTTLLHEIQHAIQEKENWARGGSVDEFKLSHSTKTYYDAIEKLRQERQPAVKMLSRLLDKGKINDEQFIKMIKELPQSKLIDELTQRALNSIDPKGSYKRLHGEQMARATEYRANMNAKERLKESYTDTLKRVEGEAPEPIVKYGDGKALSYETKRKYTNLRTGKLLENELRKDAGLLPKPLNKKEFIAQFGTTGWAKVKTPLGDVQLEVFKTWKHITDNTYHENRTNISGAFVKTLQDPLIIVHNPQKKQFEYYAPFKDGENTLHLMSINKKADGKIKNVTYFNAQNSMEKIKNIINSTDENTKYFKYARNKMMSVGEPADIRLTQVNANKQTSNSSLLNEILPNHPQKVKPADLTGNKLKGEYIKQKLESDTPHSMLYEADDIFVKDGKVNLDLDIKDKRILKYLKDNGFKSEGGKISAKATDEAIEIARVAQKMAYKKQVDDVTKKMLEC